MNSNLPEYISNDIPRKKSENHYSKKNSMSNKLNLVNNSTNNDDNRGKLI